MKNLKSNMEEKYKQFLDEGHNDEKYAMKIIEQNIGGICFIPDTDEKVRIMDMICHVDFFWETPKGIVCSIDKKMQKKMKRGDSSYMSNYTWIELLGNSGLPGSAAPHAKDVRDNFEYDIPDEYDYLMLESPNSYLFIQRYKLFKYVSDKIVGIDTVYDTPHKPYIPYQRKKYGHKDLSVLVPFTDLETITHFKIYK